MPKSKIAAAVLLAGLLFVSCNRESEQLMLTNKPDAPGKYELEELDISQMGVGAPAGICIHDGYLYVCDTENHCVVKADKEGNRIATYGTLGMEDGNFAEPMDITFADGYFYVLDSKNDRVQKFSPDFEFVELRYINSLHSAPGSGKHQSIAVDKDGSVYVSAFAPWTEDAYIYVLDGKDYRKLGERVIGYLCTGDEGVYFANRLEFHVEERVTSAKSGENFIYKVDDGKMTEIARLEDKSVPVALTCYNGGIYMISAAVGHIYGYKPGEEKLINLLSLPQASLSMYMVMDEDGNLYATDNENKVIYRAARNF